MRGASALDAALGRLPSDQIRVLAIWEPVIATDVAPPTNRVLARLDDARAQQYWDPELAVSRAIVASLPREKREELLGTPDDEAIVWDVVAGPVLVVAQVVREATGRGAAHRPRTLRPWQTSRLARASLGPGPASARDRQAPRNHDDRPDGSPDAGASAR